MIIYRLADIYSPVIYPFSIKTAAGFLGSLLLAIYAAQGQVLLEDSFNDSSLALDRWQPSTPYSDSSVSQNSGSIEFRNRGRIVTTKEVTSPVAVEGRFQLSVNPRSNIKIVLRTSGTSIGAAEMPGVAIQFSIQEDSAVRNQLTIGTQGAPASENRQVSLTRPLSLDQWYTFRVEDTGEAVRLFFDGASEPTLELASKWKSGNHVGIYNREGAGGGSSISNGGLARMDWIKITSLLPRLDLRVSQVELCWETLNGLWYQLQAQSAPVTNDWAPVDGSWFPGTGGPICTNQPVQLGEPLRVYRLVVTNQPPR